MKNIVEMGLNLGIIQQLIVMKVVFKTLRFRISATKGFSALETSILKYKISLLNIIITGKMQLPEEVH
jgi:hypothetical protein